MVRFYWRQDISKKAKIMRKVKFPTSYDATDICTPELREQLLPVSRRLSELDRDRFERRKVRKRTKAAAAAAAATAGNVAAPSTATSSTTAPSGDVEMTSADGAEDAKDGAVTNAGEALEDEEVYRKKEREELEKLVSPALKRDTGCSPTGLYELVGLSSSCIRKRTFLKICQRL
jgi:ubiquitin carboxyl-terminal hydrolase 14